MDENERAKVDAEIAQRITELFAKPDSELTTEQREAKRELRHVFQAYVDRTLTERGDTLSDDTDID